MSIKTPAKLRGGNGKPKPVKPITREYYRPTVSHLTLTSLSAWNRSRMGPKPTPKPKPNQPTVAWE